VILFGRRHPTKFTLSRYSDGDLSARRSRRVGRHVERCAECREYVRFTRELGTVARQLDSPRIRELVNADIRRESRGRRARGERTPADRVRSLESMIVVAALILVTGGYLLFAPSVSATRGELRFGSVGAGSGAATSVVYSPASYLADEDSLRLRAEVTRDAGGDLGRRVETRTVTLHRGRGGKFRGALPIEEGDLFAAAAVEDFEGARLDTNAGRLWPLHVAREGGRPSLAALESHYRSLETYNWVLAVEWAERLATERPEEPLGWAVLHWSLSRGAGADTLDAAREMHRNRLDELIRSAGPDPDLDVLPWLARYAGELGADRLRDSLLAELARRDPRHTAVLDRRVLEVAAEVPVGSPALVDRFEELWAASGRGTEMHVYFGAQAAGAAGREAALDVWIDRALRHPAVDLENLLADVEPFDPGGARRARILRARLAEIEAAGPDDRPLRMTAQAYEDHRRATVLRLNIALAGALADAGDEAAALALYREAAGRAWRPEDVRPYVDFLLARGDTAGALPGIGLLIADPVSGDSARTAYAVTLAGAVSDDAAFLAESRAELRRRVLAAVSLGRKLRGDTRLASADGEPIAAADYFSGRTSVVLLWDARFTGESRWLTAFKALASRELAEEGELRALIVVPPTSDDDLEALGAGGLAVAIDAQGDLAAQLDGRALPGFAVVAPSLQIVADLPDAATAFRVAKLLIP